MLTELLWFWDAKRQYDLQKAQGMAGLMGILYVIFLVWKWEEWFYPLFNKVGLIGLAERTGLVHDLSVMTVINVITVIFLLCLAYALIALAVCVLGVLLLSFGLSKLGQNIIVLCTLPVVAPILIYMVQKKRANTPCIERDFKKDPALKSLLEKYNDFDTPQRDFKLYLEQLQKTDDSFHFIEEFGSYYNIQQRLQKVIPSLKEFSDWCIGYDSDSKQLYILFPNPLPGLTSKAFEKNLSLKGLYGFESLWYEYYSYKPTYYVPALPLTLNWDREEITLSIDSSDSIIALKTNAINQIYKVKSKETDNLFRSLIETRQDIYEILHRAHMAVYLIPIAYWDNDIDMPEQAFYDVIHCNYVCNKDELQAIYASDVQKEIIQHAKNGQKWAINWFLKVE